jgi:hypothetical protein
MDALHTGHSERPTLTQDSGLNLELVETYPFQYVIDSTYGRSAHWKLRAPQTDPQEPGLYLEHLETPFFQYAIHPTYGRSAHWTLRAAKTGPQEPRHFPGAGRDRFLPVRHSSYIWTLCTLDAESVAK